MAKAYDPTEVERRIYETWQKSGLFRAEPDPSKEAFCIVIPPPNVTGALHIGHALDNTLQDVLVRYRRMQGYATLWLPGTDHAGIATQNVVERELRKEGLSRHDLGREKFVERVWEWKEKYGRTIIEQLKRLGSSCDWSRERFTMDAGLSRAVRKVFVDLFNEGLIYRGKRIINWCPRCETALSDVEVNHEDYHGELVHFQYPLETGGHIAVATTRLETMLGDTAIAVNPDDERYSDAVGTYALHPFFDRKLRIEADAVVDPSFGTGAVKVTPAHDATDFEIAERHYLRKINIFNTRAAINEEGGPFAGQDRYEARESVRKALKEKGLLERSEPHDYQIGRCDRCGTIVEPWLSEQWFVRMKPLAEPAIRAVKEGRTRFVPERWTNYYLNWMEQIRDWCISRQLWWGHRIPVWYCDCGFTWAAIEDPRECPECGASEGFEQDPDVLDTWFSSQLWPFSTLGWPEETADLKFFYPTSVIVPGYEIIHLWVSRMIMAGLHFMKDVPFRVAYIHGIVRDSEGRKMSKSLGNVVDPLDIIDRYGADALRFTLAEHATGQDIFLHAEWVEGSRNFANKLWNAARFVLNATSQGPFEPTPPVGPREDTRDGEAVAASDAKQAPMQPALDLPSPAGPGLDLPAPSDGGVALTSSVQGPDELPPFDRRTLADRWILSRWAQTAQKVAQNIERFEVAPAAKALYEFSWNEFCDWYIESAKLKLYGGDEQAKDDTSAVLRWVLERTLRLLHPMMPYLTEEIWGLVFGAEDELLMVQPWPGSATEETALVDVEAESRFSAIQEVVSAIRSFRSEYSISPRTTIDATFVSEDQEALSRLETQKSLVAALAGLGKVNFAPSLQSEAKSASAPSARLVAAGIDVLIELGALVDLDSERRRLGKAIARSRDEMGRLSVKLSNDQFRSKAPAEIVAEQQRRLDEETARHSKLVAQLEQLGL